MTGREKLAFKKGVVTDQRATVVRCMRCNLRWAPTLVLRRRGYQVPANWWRCPNLCNGRGTAEYDWTSDFAKVSGVGFVSASAPGKTGTATPVATASATPHDGETTDELILRGRSSGEVLSFARLELGR